MNTTAYQKTDTQSPQKSASVGLSDAQAEQSRKACGDNRLSEGTQKSFFRHFVGNLNDPVIRILLGALLVNLLFVFRGGDWPETVGIAISVFLATLISTLSERGSEAAFRRLSDEMGKGTVRLWRNGRLQERPMEELVVGDRIEIGAGEQIPADAWLLSGHLRVDQSAMTGENREIAKSPAPRREPKPENPCALFRGTSVLSGQGSAEVFAVGDATFLGQIAEEIRTEARESPLKIRLAKLARQISRLGYLAAFLVGFAYLFHVFVIGSGFQLPLIVGKLRNLSYLMQHLLRAFMLGLTVVVMSVPEGLPMMVAVVPSANMRRMVRDKVFVRKPVGIEAAGSMNLLFTDKTGTLTEGKMSVRRIVSADGIEYQNAAALRRQAPALYRLYDLSCRLNTAATLGDQTVLGGNATERALLESVRRLPPSPSSPCLGSLPFDSVKKYSAVSLGVPAETVLIKGAPERLLPFLQTAYRSDGRTVPFSRLSSAFLRQIGTLTANGERVLLLAECSALPSGNHFEPLTLIGAVSLNDKIRTEAPPSIRKLREAGIQTVMITGDHRDTARQIAVQCGILTPSQNLIVSSEELARCSDEAVKEMLPRLAVVARALPSDKSRLVRLAQETERVVGMTGDGINDAPALKRADIGFAMGSGAAVAKDAGDIIILDNNLSSIAKAVLYGRTIFKSIRKFITLQLTMNFCAVGVSMIGPFIGYDAPVTVTQMLWINLIMDTLGGLAFAGEAPSPRYMKEKPKRRDEPILNRYMVHQIVFLGGFTVALCLAFLLLPSITSSFRAEPNRLYLLTAFFALFIFTSVFNCFNTRSDRLNLFSGLSKNKPFLFIMSAVCVVQLLFVYLGGDILRTLPLTPSELKRTLLLSLSVFPAEFLRKVMWRLGRHTDGF